MTPIDAILEDFDRQCGKGHASDVRAFMEQHGASSPELLRQLIPRAFRWLWHTGGRIPAEVYLRRFPEVTLDADLVVDLISVELSFLEVEPDMQRYIERFPDYADDVRHALEAYQMLLASRPLSWYRRTLDSLILGQETIPLDDRDAFDGAVTVGSPSETRVTLRDQFEIDSELGSGAFKRVFRARQASTGQWVALKRPREDRKGGDVAGGLIAEARVQARLSHQNIPPILSLGADEDVAGIFVEKLIPGCPWSEVMDSLSLRENLEILLEVSDAAAFAHSNHVIHRDIKPQNVMLSDEFGEVYLVDWGLAVHVGPEPDDSHPAPHKSRLEHAGGTPAYMAPEAARGEQERIGPATDVFSLGGVLYRILTGKTPRRCTNALAWFEAICQPIIPPERRAADRIVPAELSQIAVKSLALDVEDRFPEAAEFSTAIRQYLAHAAAEEIFDAASARLREEQRLARENRTANTIRESMGRLLGIADQFRQVRSDYERPNSAAPNGSLAMRDFGQAGWSQACQGEQEARFLLVDLALKQGDFSLAQMQLNHLEGIPETPQGQWTRYQAKVARSLRRRRSGRAALWLASAAALAAVMVGTWLYLRSQELDRLRRIEQAEVPNQKGIIAASEGFHSAAALWYSESLLAFDRPSVRCSLIESLQQSLVPIETTSRRGGFSWLSYSTDGQFLHGALSDGRVFRWRLRDGELDSVVRTGFDDDPDLVACLLDLEVLPDSADEFLAVGPDGTLRQGSFSAPDREPRQWKPSGDDAGRWTALAVEPRRSAGGKRRVVLGSSDGRLLWLTLPSGNVLKNVQAHEQRIRSLNATSDGKTIGSAGDDGVVRFWDFDGNECGSLTTPKRPEDDGPHSVRSLCFSPDNRCWAAAAWDGSILLGEISSSEVIRLPPHVGDDPSKALPLFAVDFLSNDRLVSGGSDGVLREYDIPTRSVVRERGRHGGDIFGDATVKALAVAPNGEIAANGCDYSLKRWGPDPTKPIAEMRGMLGAGSGIGCIAADFSIDKNFVVTAGLATDGFLRLWSLDPLREQGTFPIRLDGPPSRQIAPSAVAISPDGSRILSAERTGEIIAWNVDAREILFRIHSRHVPLQVSAYEDSSITQLVWDTNGQSFLSIGADGWVRRWDAQSHELIREWQVLEANRRTKDDDSIVPRIVRAALLDEKNNLAVWDSSRTLELWSLDGETLSEITSPSGAFLALARSLDSQLLATGTDDGFVTVWSMDSKTPLFSVHLTRQRTGYEARLEPHPGETVLQATSFEAAALRAAIQVRHLAFSRDSRLLAATRGDATVWLIDVAVKDVLTFGAGHESNMVDQGCSGIFFDASGRLVSVGSDGTLRRWDMAAALQAMDQPLPDVCPRQVIADPNGDEWAIVTIGRELMRWSESKRTTLPVDENLSGTPVTAAAYAPKVSELIIGLGDGSLSIVDRETGDVRRTIPAPVPTAPETTSTDDAITAVAVDPSGRYIAINGAATSIHIYDLLEQHWLTHFVTQKRIYSLAFHPSRMELAGVEANGTLTAWNVPAGTVRFQVSGGPLQQATARGLAYSPDGKRLAHSGSNSDRIVLYDANTGEMMQSLIGHRAQRDTWLSLWCINNVAFSPDGRSLVSVASDATARLWRIGDNGMFEATSVVSIATLGALKAEDALVVDDPSWRNSQRLERMSEELARKEAELATSGAPDALKLPRARSLELLTVTYDTSGQKFAIGGWNVPLSIYEVNEIDVGGKSPEELREHVADVTKLRLRGETISPQELNRLAPVE